IGWVGVHSHPVESFKLNGVSRQLGNISQVARLSGKPHTAPHGKRPFGNRPVGSVCSQGVKEENENEHTRHNSEPLTHTRDLQTWSAETFQFLNGLRRER